MLQYLPVPNFCATIFSLNQLPEVPSIRAVTASILPPDPPANIFLIACRASTSWFLLCLSGRNNYPSRSRFPVPDRRSSRRSKHFGHPTHKEIVFQILVTYVPPIWKPTSTQETKPIKKSVHRREFYLCGERGQNQNRTFCVAPSSERGKTIKSRVITKCSSRAVSCIPSRPHQQPRPQ